MADLSFPLSSTPGALAGEGEGRLINCAIEKQGDRHVIRRVPGLAVAYSAGQSTPRGFTLGPASEPYAAFSGVAMRGTALLTGALTGTDLVTWAMNNKTPTPDLVAVRESGGAYVVSTTTVSAYPDADLPATANSVAFLGGFFIFTIPDGRIFASDLNTTAVNALSFGSAETSPDGLKRGIVHANTYYAMGATTIEPWLNAGTSPFPLRRATSVIPFGLLTAAAVAGHEQGFGGNPVFVASDGTVREILGYEAKKVSTVAVERFIALSTIATLEACVYTSRGRQVWVLISDIGSWEYNVANGTWNERASDGDVRWRGSRSMQNAAGNWYIGDRSSTSVLQISDTTRIENVSPLTATWESGPLKAYPAREVIPSLYADLTDAAATITMSYSKDGGATWTTPATGSLANADKYPVSWNRLGRATHHGLRVRFAIADAVDFAFLAASVPDLQIRKP